MFPEIPPVSQQAVFPQQTTRSIWLPNDEVISLTELEANAKIIAPIFSQAFTMRLQQFAGIEFSYIDNIDLHLNLQRWFWHLFQPKGDHALRYRELSMPIPIEWLLAGLDVILTYGYEVTREGSHPTEATQAFYKNLTQKIAHEQIQFPIGDLQHFTEMILLD